MNKLEELEVKMNDFDEKYEVFKEKISNEIDWKVAMDAFIHDFYKEKKSYYI